MSEIIGVFPDVTCTTHWIPEGLYSRAAKPLSQHLQTANHLKLQHCHLYIGLSCNSLLFYFLFSYFIISISCTWSWIIDVHGPVYVPPRELAGHISGKACLRHFRWPEMSTDENHRQAQMTLRARKLCGVFATTSFNFVPPTYFISHCCRRALHAVLYRRDFF